MLTYKPIKIDCQDFLFKQLCDKALNHIKSKNLNQPIKMNTNLYESEQKAKQKFEKIAQTKKISIFIQRLVLFFQSIQYFQYKQQKKNFVDQLFDLFLPINLDLNWQTNIQSWWLNLFTEENYKIKIKHYILYSFYQYVRNQESKKKFIRNIAARNLQRVIQRLRKQSELKTQIALFCVSLTSIVGYLPFCFGCGLCCYHLCKNTQEYWMVKVSSVSDIAVNETGKIAWIFGNLYQRKITLSIARQFMEDIQADICLEQIIEPLFKKIQQLFPFNFFSNYNIKLDQNILFKQNVVNYLYQKAINENTFQSINQFCKYRNEFIEYCINSEVIQDSLGEDNRNICFPGILFASNQNIMKIFYKKSMTKKQILNLLNRKSYINIQYLCVQEITEIANSFFSSQFNVVKIYFGDYELTKQKLVNELISFIPLFQASQTKMIVLGQCQLYTRL